MLDIDYSQRLNQLLATVDWDWELPSELSDLFAGNRDTSIVLPDDERSNQRIAIRTRAILWSEVSLPFCKRDTNPIGVYIRDFSRFGAGFLAPFELFPEEEVRIVLPTFWILLKVVRTRRLGKACYEIGTTLIWKREPSAEAFASGSELSAPNQ